MKIRLGKDINADLFFGAIGSPDSCFSRPTASHERSLIGLLEPWRAKATRKGK